MYSVPIIMNTVCTKDLRNARRFAKRAKTSQNTSKRGSAIDNKDKLVQSSCVERPLPYSRTSISFERQNPVRNFIFKRGLSCPQLLHWTSWSGYHVETIVNILNSIPATVYAAIADTVAAINLINKLSAPEELNSKLSKLLTVSDDYYAANHAAEKLLNLTDFEWASDHSIGYQIITLDPDSQVRKDHKINSGLASMFGMHKEEMLSRLANHDLPLHYIDVDAMCMLALMVLKHPVPGRKVKYFRMCAGRARRCILVAQYSVVIADDFGRIVQVLNNDIILLT